MPAAPSYSNKIGSALFCILVVACGSPDPLPPACVDAKPDIGEKEHLGKYDYTTCNKSDCHFNSVGGWVYNNPEAEEAVQGATVTIINSDNTTAEAMTRSDGFFVLLRDRMPSGNTTLSVDDPSNDDPSYTNTIVPPFKPCISKCPGIECAKKPHTSTDCQSSGCHGGDDSQLYVSLERTIPLPCENLPNPGPRVHKAMEFDGAQCWTCHDRTYIGGYVYDGLTSDTAVDRAEVTLISSSTGYTISAVSGPGGLFHFENGIFAPYVACVKKCGESVCSLPESHPTADDCRDCHDENNRIYVPW